MAGGTKRQRFVPDDIGQTQAHGAPFMPSGVLYTRGLLSSYLVALAGHQHLQGSLPLPAGSVDTVNASPTTGSGRWRSCWGERRPRLSTQS